MTINTWEGDVYPSSRCVFLTQEHFLKGCNVNCENLYKDIIRIPVNSYHLNRTTLLLLEILKAYDINKNIELLNLAEKLAQWVADNQPEDKDNSSIFNLIQIRKRKRKGVIDEHDKFLILEILSSGCKEQYKAAGYILLDMPEKAKEVIEQMDEEERNTFQNFPIYNLLDKKSFSSKDSLHQNYKKDIEELEKNS